MATHGTRTARSPGYTLTEMLGVVVILAIGAAAVVPTLTQSDRSKIELAASEVGSVLRFARDEARRKSAPTVVMFSGNARLQAFELDVSDPANPKLGTALHHPVAKDVYDLDLHTLRFSTGVTLTTNLPSGPGAGSAVGFNARGEPLNASTLGELPDRYIDVSFGSRTRRIGIASLTARITEAWQ